MTRACCVALLGVALASVVLLVGIFAWQSVPVWQHEGAGYVTGAKWFFRQEEFGALPMIYGSSSSRWSRWRSPAPLGMGAAIFTAEYLPQRARLAVKVLDRAARGRAVGRLWPARHPAAARLDL